MIAIGRPRICLAVLVLLSGSLLSAEPQEKDPLVAGLRPWLELLSGQQKQFELSGNAVVTIDGHPQAIALRLVRFDDSSFDLQLTHSEYALSLHRRGDSTSFALPKHKVVFTGSGDVAASDQLAPAGITSRMLGPGTSITDIAALVQNSNAVAVAAVLKTLAKAKFDRDRWRVGDDLSFRFTPDNSGIEVTADSAQFQLTLKSATGQPQDVSKWPGMKVVELPRAELERQLVRGVRRALEILAPSRQLKSPLQTARSTAHGQLRWIGGQRVVLLKGTPDEIGRAHGKLLRTETQRCIDSVLYTFGTVQTIHTGRWFSHDLAAAYKRLSPHIPDDHKLETRALAASLGIDPHLAETLNVFPELFHCSGFAVFGKATRDGKLYHGRVLDYMTTIGLQDAATTFIVAVDGKIPFANVGYAGFTGSVSGMNARAISLGEMGGRGEGQWDGVPMATLMRRALEECSTLDQVIALWKTSPRTCEYYYLFADGKTNRAVGVSAVPEKIELVLPGQSHPLLGEGIEDVVVLSAGNRLEKLRARVTARHGAIDEKIGQWLMSRPVAMQSNLHNVLFVPQDGVLYVANADHEHPAAERPYVRLDLNELLRSMDGPASTAADPAKATGP